jgi:hypothetical protein
MLRAAGLSASAMKVVDREKGVFDPSYMWAQQLTDTVILLNLNGKDVVLDPGQKLCPFQLVSWRHSGAGGIRQGAEGRSIGVTPSQSYTSNTLLRTGELNIDEHAAVSGRFSFVFSGQQALGWRQAVLLNDLDEVKKEFDEWLREFCPDGPEAHLDHFIGLDDPDVNLIAIVKVEGGVGTATSRRLLLPGFFFETRGSHPFVDQEKRLEPVDMHYADQVTDQVVFHLPPGFTVEGAPQNTQIPWPGHASFATKSIPASGQITIARQLTRAFTLVKPDEYQSLRDFYQKIASADQQQLVLVATPTAKGN